MAMDSHDEYYELHLIDTDNNNHNRKSSDSSIGQNGNPEPGPHVSSSAVGTLSGSSKRKQCSLSKGLTIEEFLQTVDQNSQLTAIDKLILKNKAALAEDQMKRVRVKSTDKITASQKKNDRKSKTKVANSKNSKAEDTNGKNKTNGVKAKNSKPIADEKSKKTAKSATSSEPKNRAESRPSGSDSRVRTETRTLNGDHKGKAPKKQASVDAKGVKSNEKAAPARKTLLQSVRKSRREPKVNCKSFDMKRLKSNVAYRTRSVNNEKLRNGKTRIIRSLPDETLLETKKKLSRSKDGTSSPGVTPARSVLKRPIKQEPREEDGCPGRKRKSSAPCVMSSTRNNDENTGVQSTSRSASTPDERLHSELIVKKEPCREDKEEQSNMKVNVSESSNDPQSANCTSESKNVSKFPEDKPVPYDLMIKNNCPDPVIKVEKETPPINPVDDEGSHDDDTSESLNLQLDNLDDDLEMEVDDQSCTTETESIMDEMNEESSTAKKPNSQPLPLPDDSARDSIFSALGLQSIERNSQKSKSKETKDEIYRGTLKMVIKTDNGCRRMEIKRTDNSQSEKDLSFYAKIPPNGNDRDILNTSPTESSGSSGMSSLFVEDDADTDEVKTTVSEVPTVTIVEEVTSVDNGNQTGKNSAKPGLDKSKGDDVSLVVPEKSSSFSIHPDRLCSDVCNYCRGKFGLLDTPCHVGQLKNLERQEKILAYDPNVQIDTCLCDGCFRHVIHKMDRKKGPKMTKTVGQRKVKCAVQGCDQLSIKYFSKRKWRSKLFRKFSNLSFDFGKKGSNAGHGLCAEHFNMMDLYTLCGICKKRLSRNEMYSVQSEVNDLNIAFVEDGIPVKLTHTDNMLVCKYCHHCMSLRLNFGDPSQMSASNRDYYESFKKEILCNLQGLAGNGEQKKSPESQKLETTGILVLEKANGAKEPVIDDHPAPSTTSTPATKQGSNATNTSEKNRNVNNHQGEQKRSEPEKKRVVNTKGTANPPKPMDDEKSAESNKNRNVGIKDIASWLKPLESEHSSEKNSTHIQLKFGNLNIGKLSNLNIGQNTQPLPVPEKKKERSPEEAELPLKADFSFDNDDPSRGWERCVSTIQFDKSTKKLWQDLQKPYGNQSSFIRHLIMLEKYWRSGALVLSDSADPGAVKYISSVKNRIESLEVSPAPKLPPVPALALAPVPAPAPMPIPQKPVMRKSEKLIPMLTPTPPPLQPAPRPPHPPPLLKLTCSSPFLVRKTTPVCTVRPSPEFSFKTVRTPPRLERIPTVYLSKPVPNSSNRGMMQPHVLSKQQMIQMDAHHRGRTVSVSVVKKSASITNGNNSGVRAYSPQYIAKSSAPVNVSSSVILSKLPKALTVTQIDDMTVKDRKEAKPQIAAPFLAGEKPSVTVFREVTK